jgi:bile acid:Na+ symporter, BASS family
MRELVVDTLKIVAPISVALIVFSQGLGISPRLVAAYWKQRPGLMVRSLVAALVLAPAAALAVILLFKPAPGVAIGLAILMACPPAPLTISSAPRQGASAPFMASLHLSLAPLALLTLPAALYLLSIAFDFSAEVHLGVMAWILAKTILLPIGLGITLHSIAPAFAERIAPVLGKAGSICFLIVVLLVLGAAYRSLFNMDWWSYLVIATVSVVMLATGHLLGPSVPAEKTALAIECGVRHHTLAFTVAVANFGVQRALLVLVPCICTFVVIAMLYLAGRARSMAGAGNKAG